MLSKFIGASNFLLRFQKWWNMSVDELMAKDEKPPVIEQQPPLSQPQPAVAVKK